MLCYDWHAKLVGQISARSLSKFYGSGSGWVLQKFRDRVRFGSSSGSGSDSEASPAPITAQYKIRHWRAYPERNDWPSSDLNS